MVSHLFEGAELSKVWCTRGNVYYVEFVGDVCWLTLSTLQVSQLCLALATVGVRDVSCGQAQGRGSEREGET